MSKSFDKRLRFIAMCLNNSIADANQANTWYIANKAKGVELDALVARFKEWLVR